MGKNRSTVATADNGRGPDGKFLPGNRAAAGNPIHKHVAALRAGLLQAVSEKDVHQIARKLVTMALAGDVAAARVLLERLLGPPVPADLLARIEALEADEGKHDGHGTTSDGD